MKKTVLVIFLMAICVSVFAQSGQIRELSGTVELQRPGSASFTAARAGDRVSQDTVISTGFRSSALVEVGSTLITVRPLTRLTLTEIQAAAGSETINMNLQAGRVRVDVNPPAGTRASMSVSSPIATASVRGTSFEFDTRNLQVNSGRVSFSGWRGRSINVDGGGASRVEGDGRAEDPIVRRGTRLRPKAPVGTGESGASASDIPSSLSGDISISVEY